MTRSKLFLAAALLAGGTLPVDAALLVQQENWGTLSPAFDSQTPAVDPVTFNRFDPSLGTLQSVTVVTYVEFDQGNASIDAEGLLPSDITVEFGVEVDYTSSDVSLVNTLGQPIGTGVEAFNSETFTNVGANDGDDPLSFQDDGGNDNRDMTITLVSAQDSGQINAAFQAGYVGVTTFDIHFEGSSLFNIISTGSTSGSFNPGLASGYVEITYNYLPAVPEPSTALSLLAVAGIMGFRRRSRA